MSDKHKQGGRSAVLDETNEEQPDERDQEELNQARQRDSQHAKPAHTQVRVEDTEEASDTGEDEAGQGEPAEIVALDTAFQRFRDSIKWHEEEITRHQAEIEEHRSSIDTLKSDLRSRFESLVGEITDGRATANPTRPRGRPPLQQTAQKKTNNGSQPGARTRTSYGEGNSTGDLIAACLKRSKNPVNTESLVKYLGDHGNNTNPSVELSRLVKKGVVERRGRGFYVWVGE